MPDTAALFESLFYIGIFDFRYNILQGNRKFPVLKNRRFASINLLIGKVLYAYFRLLTEDHHSFYYVLELPDITRPVGILHYPKQFGAYDLVGSQILICLSEEVQRQWNDIFASFSKGRNLNGDNAQPVEQIFTELATLHHRFQVSVCGGYDTAVNLLGLRTAHPHNFPCFQER